MAAVIAPIHFKTTEISPIYYVQIARESNGKRITGTRRLYRLETVFRKTGLGTSDKSAAFGSF